MSTRAYKRIRRMALVAAATAAIGVPAAQAADPGSYIGHPGGPVGVGLVTAALSPSGSYIGHPGGPGGVGLVPAPLNSSGSYIGHPGGPGGVGLISTAASSSDVFTRAVARQAAAPDAFERAVNAHVSMPSINARSAGGFDWADAAIGGGFVAGLGLLGAGTALMLRRRGILAEQR